MRRELFRLSLRPAACGARFGLLGLLIGAPIVVQVLEASPSIVPFNATAGGAILLAGTCAIDARNGVLRAVLARPVTRWSYVATRLAGSLALLVIASECALAASLAGCALAGDVPSTSCIARLASDRALDALPVAAYWTAASAALPIACDFVLGAAIAVASLGAGVLEGRAPAFFVSALRLPWNLLVPRLDVGTTLALLRSASCAAIVLALGAWIFARRDLPSEARS